MSWSSILPEHLSYLETWFARFFLVAAALTFGPWGALIIYDLILYIWRSIIYEIPVVGGRAHGGPRPRAPSLTVHADGHRRTISLTRDTSRGDNPTTSAPDIMKTQESNGTPLARHDEKE